MAQFQPPSFHSDPTLPEYRQQSVPTSHDRKRLLQYPSSPQFYQQVLPTPQPPGSPVRPPAPKDLLLFTILSTAVAIIAILFLIIVAILALSQTSSSSGSTLGTTTAPMTQATQLAVQPQNQPTGSLTRAPTPVPTPMLTWTTMQTFTGNGNQKTVIFNTLDDWKILYTCTYQDIDGVTADSTFTISVYNADGSVADPAAIDVTCKNGIAETTGETEEHQEGQVYLSIYATGGWTIEVEEMK